MKKKTLLAPSLFLSGILLFSGCGSSATTSAVHQNKSADSWAVEASEPLDDSGFSYDGEADMMDDTATAETAGSSSDSSASDAATDAAEATHDQSTRKLIRTVSMDIATEDLDTLRTKLDNSITSCGGYIESSTLDTPQNGYSRRSYYVTARIPSDNLDSFLETAGTLGTVTNKTSPSDTLIRKPTWIPSEPNTTVSANFSSRPLSWIRSWPSSPSSPTCATRSTATKPSFEPTTTW